ncbi:2-polyprenyl-3-methyl-6-methoxy-1,4-benzoquinone monooxygenase [Leptothrix discophora]|uniref:3-demethoxyubiquinol 3-hydroxylase n=1 Tax=Leptothrix discophora TaxID=89 RepID=A0ABT9G6W0_LEPDI|nr:2-polyprenyl-3-methyl-6-methoxy-1,4-benzoquinone monooxygenase [Leptothrix discophora]MDP4301923.1 2-polyprenyl-3-methyl-6-methoxy-1,4-benzoquinone monooxygenase [Leptothrix discophora]
MMQTRDTLDRVLGTVDIGLRTVWGHHHAQRPRPQVDGVDDAPMTETERALAGALMRVNHVGEVCAQALYNAQALATPDPGLRAHFDAAAADEVDHLAWTEQRLRELGTRPSVLNPLWYAGAFAIGLAAGRMGRRASLGFVIETERQVEQHLQSHLDRLPAQDRSSRAIVTQMRDDEARHAIEAQDAGGLPPPPPVRWLMRAAAKVMTTAAHRI